MFRGSFTGKSATFMSSRWSKAALFTVSALGAGSLYDHYFYEDTGYRTLKSLYVLTRIGLDYKLNFKESEDIAALHQRNATRLTDLLYSNKGLYIKLGQNFANQASIFPKAFQEKFARFYDAAPQDTWEQVDKILSEELGSDYEEKYFNSIDKKPIASASIAQVHQAVLKNGEKVALKVQHHYISKQMHADLWVYRFFLNIYEKAFEIPVSFSGAYISERLAEEVDFNNELQNARRCEKLIASDAYLRKKVHVPTTHEELTTKRILTAEWCDGDSLVKGHDLQSKYNTKNMVYDYLDLFAKMMFEWGFVHSDPHPGNILVRYNKDTRNQELVLLDHGLYVELSEKLRLQYCTVWKSMFELNEKELRKIVVSWGVGSEQSGMFASFTMLKPYQKGREQMNKMTKFEREEFMKNNFKNFFKETEKFPLELIFLSRTMKMVQTVNQRFKAPINRINLFTKEAVKGYYLNNVAINHTTSRISLLRQKSEGFLRYTIFLMTMTISDLAYNVTRFGQYIFGTKNIEDVLQQEMMKHLKDMGVENPEEIDIFSG